MEDKRKLLNGLIKELYKTSHNTLTIKNIKGFDEEEINDLIKLKSIHQSTIEGVPMVWKANGHKTQTELTNDETAIIRYSNVKLTDKGIQYFNNGFKFDYELNNNDSKTYIKTGGNILINDSKSLQHKVKKNKRDVSYWGAIGSIVIVFLTIYQIFFADNTGILNNIGDNNINTTLVEGNNNQVNNNSIDNYIVNANNFIDELYPDILYDYHFTLLEKIKQDFGEANNINEISINSDGEEYKYEYDIKEDNKFIKYDYNLKNGNISFYIDIKTNYARMINVNISYNSYINIPGLEKNKYREQGIVLGKSSFKDIFNIQKPSTILGASGTIGSYSEISIYGNGTTGYKNYIFGVNGFYHEDIEWQNGDITEINDYKLSLLENEFPNYLLIY